MWADNIFLVSSSIIDIVQRTQDTLNMSLGREISVSTKKSLEILPSKTAEKEATRVWLNEKMEFSWVPVLVVFGCHLDGSGSTGSGTGAKNVWQNASVAVLLEDSGGRTHENVLLHGCFMCLVGFGLLDSVDKSSAIRLAAETGRHLEMLPQRLVSSFGKIVVLESGPLSCKIFNGVGQF